MALGERLRAAGSALFGSLPAAARPRAEGNGVVFESLSDPALADYIRGGYAAKSGALVTETTALRVATAWRCASIICGVVGSLPADLMLREDENARSPAVNHPFRNVLTVAPNPIQTPGEFKKMLQLHKLQNGNGFALIVRFRGQVITLWPLDPLRMRIVEHADRTLTYLYSSRTGQQMEFQATEILHLRGLSWDGVRGLPVIRYMAEAIGVAITTQRAAGTLLKNGQFTPGFFKMGAGTSLSEQAYDRLKKSIDENSGTEAEKAFKALILEEGMEYQAGAVDAREAQLIDIAGFGRDDIGAFYGVPPHLYGDTVKSTSWGTGIEQQNLGFLQYTIQDHLTTWSEVMKRDCISGPKDDPRLYVHFDLKGFLRADAVTRSAYFSRALGAGGQAPWMTQNEVRGAEDLPKRKEAWADTLAQNGSGKPVETGNNGNQDQKQQQ